MRRCNRRTQLVLLTAGLSLLLLAIYLVGALIPESAYASDYLAAKLPPSWEHPFGTDSLGRDLLMRTLKGLSISMTVGIAASAISAVIAVLVGIAAATGAQWVDAVINWVIDLVMGVPHTILVILISFALGRGLKGLLIGIAATHEKNLREGKQRKPWAVPPPEQEKPSAPKKPKAARKSSGPARGTPGKREDGPKRSARPGGLSKAGPGGRKLSGKFRHHP